MGFGNMGLGLGLNRGKAAAPAEGEAATPPVNTVAPVITGDAEVGSLLTCSTGTFTGSPAPTLTYQWRAEGVDIGAATASTYTTIEGDIGDDIDCVVTGTNSEGADSEPSSNAVTVEAEGGGETLEAIDIVGDIEITEASYPTLTLVTGDININNCTNLTTISAPSLLSVGGTIDIYSNAALTSVDFSSLQTVGGAFYITQTAIASMDLSDLQTVGGELSISNNASLASINIGALLAVTGVAVFDENAFNQATVDAILVKFAAMDGTAGTTSYDNMEVNVGGGTSAAPSATGLTAQATLEGRGNMVTVNS